MSQYNRDIRLVRVTLTCEECGKIGLMEGDEDVLHLAIETRTNDHWADAHPYPNMRYDWSEE